MRTVFVVLFQPVIDIMLQFIKRRVNIFPEGDLIKLIQDSSLKPLAVPISLRRSGLRLCVIDILYKKIELVLVMFPIGAELCPTICEVP
jgi:hypothetical protein